MFNKASECCGAPLMYDKHEDAIICRMCRDIDWELTEQREKKREDEEYHRRMRNADRDGYDSFGYPFRETD